MKSDLDGIFNELDRAELELGKLDDLLQGIALLSHRPKGGTAEGQSCCGMAYIGTDIVEKIKSQVHRCFAIIKASKAPTSPELFVRN